MSRAIVSHRKVVNTSLQEMASTLVDILGRVLVAGIVGVRHPKTVSRWANGDVTAIRDRYSEERLMALYQVVSLMQQYEGNDTIRAFMIGMNPSLDDLSPALTIRNGNYKDALGAAKLLISGGYA